MTVTAERAVGLEVLGLMAMLAVIGLLFFDQLGHIPLFDVDEPRYAETARQMVVNHHWITPVFNGEPRLVKPPLFYWLAAWSSMAFGVSEFSARLVSAVAASALVFGVYALGRAFAGSRTGILAGLILATSLEFAALARMAITDMTLSACIGLTMGVLFLAVHRSSRWWLAAGLIAGLGLLVKGPVAVVLPGAVALIYSVMVGRFRHTFWNAWFPLALMISVAMAAPWFFWAAQENGPAFWQITLENNVGRFSGQAAYHPQPWYFFVIVLAAGFLPWSVYLPVAVADRLSAFRRSGQSLRQRIALDPLFSLTLYSGLAWLTVFAFFSASSTKLLTYILPLFAPLALFLACCLEARLRELGGQKPSSAAGWLACGVLLWVGLAVAGGIAATRLGVLLPKEAAHMAGDPVNGWLAGLLLAGTAMAVWLLSQRRLFAFVLVQALTMALVGNLAFRSVVPAVNALTQGDMLDFVKTVRAEQLAALPGTAPALASFHITRPSLTYYAQQNIHWIDLGERDTLAQLLQARGVVYLITKNSFVNDLKAIVPAGSTLQTVSQRRVYHLLRLTPNRNPANP
ncbi:MAG: ArnT family glycosyltransferase [Candidatus Melainabacteria bacterium]